MSGTCEEASLVAPGEAEVEGTAAGGGKVSLLHTHTQKPGGVNVSFGGRRAMTGPGAGAPMMSLPSAERQLARVERVLSSAVSDV